MKYILTNLNARGQKVDRVMVEVKIPAFKLCAAKLKEFNPVPFANQSVDDIVKEMVSQGDELIRQYADKLSSAPGFVVSSGTGGYVVQAFAFHPVDRIYLEVLIDPGVLWYGEQESATTEGIDNEPELIEERE